MSVRRKFKSHYGGPFSPIDDQTVPHDDVWSRSPQGTCCPPCRSGELHMRRAAGRRPQGGNWCLAHPAWGAAWSVVNAEGNNWCLRAVRGARHAEELTTLGTVRCIVAISPRPRGHGKHDPARSDPSTPRPALPGRP